MFGSNRAKKTIDKTTDKENKMSRKTTTVKSLLVYANEQLSRKDEYATMSFKMGICNMIEMVLMDTKNYVGFMFLNNDDSELHTMGYWNRRYYFSRKL